MWGSDLVQVERLVKHTHGQFGVTVIDHTGDTDLRGADQADVDVFGRQGGELQPVVGDLLAQLRPLLLRLTGVGAGVRVEVRVPLNEEATNA